MGEDQQPQIPQEGAGEREPQNRWGDPISEERQNELRGYLDRWENEQDHGERTVPSGRLPFANRCSGIIIQPLGVKVESRVWKAVLVASSCVTCCSR
jgi:hypothetical protein